MAYWIKCDKFSFQNFQPKKEEILWKEEKSHPWATLKWQ